MRVMGMWQHMEMRMEQQSIFERVMRRGAERSEGMASGMIEGRDGVARLGNGEVGKVKTHNRLILLSSAGIAILGVLATVVLAKQNVISLPGIAMGKSATSESVKAADTGSAVAQANLQKNTAAGNDVAAAEQKTIFSEHVEKAGVTACKDVFPALGFAAAAGSTFNATTSWSDKDPASHSISSIVGMRFDTGQLKGSGASFVFSAPTPAKDGCEGTFVRVVPVAQDCSSFAATLPKESTLGPSLQGLPVITLPSGVQTVLIPSAGNGCVVLTTSRAATAAG